VLSVFLMAVDDQRGMISGIATIRYWLSQKNTSVNRRRFSSGHNVIVNITNHTSDVTFEVFTAVTMKNGIFWDVTPCGSCRNRRFGGT
jgi:hypothetical protein